MSTSACSIILTCYQIHVLLCLVLTLHDQSIDLRTLQIIYFHDLIRLIHILDGVGHDQQIDWSQSIHLNLEYAIDTSNEAVAVLLYVLKVLW